MTVPEVAKVRVFKPRLKKADWILLLPALVFGAIVVGLIVLVCWCLSKPVPPCEVCVP